MVQGLSAVPAAKETIGIPISLMKRLQSGWEGQRSATHIFVVSLRLPMQVISSRIDLGKEALKLKGTTMVKEPGQKAAASRSKTILPSENVKIVLEIIELPEFVRLVCSRCSLMSLLSSLKYTGLPPLLGVYEFKLLSDEYSVSAARAGGTTLFGSSKE